MKTSILQKTAKSVEGWQLLLSRSPRKALKLWILHIFLTPTSEAGTEQSSQDFSGGIRKPGMVICLDLSALSRLPITQLQSVALFMLFSPHRVFYQPRLCSTLDVLGNHHSLIESQSLKCVPFPQHCYVCSTVSLAGR